MKEYELSEPLTEEFFIYLKNFGTVEPVSKLDTGFYQFTKPNWFSIKGLIGDTSIEVRFKSDTMDITADFLRILILKFSDKPDITYLHQCEQVREDKIKKYLSH